MKLYIEGKDENQSQDDLSLEDKFLLGAGNTYTANDTGGNATHTHSIGHTHEVPGVSHKHTTGNHTLTINEIPSHSHQGKGYHNVAAGSDRQCLSWHNDVDDGGGVWSYPAGGGGAHNHGDTGFTTPDATVTNSQSTSTSGLSSNMPPYLVVYMWKRVEDK